MQPSTTSTPRQAYLDWLRIIAIIGVLILHSGMPYATDLGWHIRNATTSNVLLEVNVFLHRFRMPLLFFISGTVSYYMLQRRSGGGFIGLRFRRLFIPLVVGMLLIVPPQVYMERLTQGFKGNFWDFYPTIFTTGVYPHGNMSWHHLWFILYLLVYDIICAPLFVWLMSPKGKHFLQRFSANRYIHYLFMIPGVLIYAFFAARFEETHDLIHDYAFAPYWLFFVLAGFICIANPVFMDNIERSRRLSFAFAFLSLLFINYLRWNQLEDYTYVQGVIVRSIASLSAWTWVFTAVGYGKKYLNKFHPSLNYLNQAVYPFYILHQTVIVIISYYLVQPRVSDDVTMKYFFTVGVTLFISMSIFHLFIRPFPVMRTLFGMKPEKKEKEREKEAVISSETAVAATI
ncbi:MAG TPA: acyltransferase family protein [Chitinophaga sp.]|uniref:acyltransferase family protein n=1 Tax=Chitinophaga sp. TaxID=1869181 RepID=UPI002BBD491E|nr:acyltransferase family protein [Chitinophaga sp.]HVI46394.1 acyltransferase family protein [Chitinophaga sp.]